MKGEEVRQALLSEQEESTMCRNMHTDPAFEPWREAAIRNGYASSLVLPLISEGKPFGAISIYSKEPDPFLGSRNKSSFRTR